MAFFKILPLVCVISIVFFCCFNRFSVLARPIPDALNSKYIKVPTHVFEKSVKSATDSVHRVISILSSFQNVNNNSRPTGVIEDCLHWFDSVTERLQWSRSIIYQKNAGQGTGDVSSDLRTWLGSALTYQATCLEELVGTNSFLEETVAESMDQAIAKVKDLQSMVRLIPCSKPNFSTALTLNRKEANVTVAADGSGNFTTIMDAMKDIPKQSKYIYVIYIKKGIYNEFIEIEMDFWNVVMIGDGMGETIITGDRSNSSGWRTIKSATFGVDGFRFIAMDITFENTAGEEGYQAVALRSSGDLSIFYRCEIKGYQDTLYALNNRQFYRECKISGTVDFIFGDGTAVFQKCDIISERHNTNTQTVNTITAQKRTAENYHSGFSFHMCNIIGGDTAYLGRPWEPYARVVFMESYLSEIVDPEGWLPWYDNGVLDPKVFYAEYKNTGPGSSVKERTKSPGVHVAIDKNTAMNFTVSEFISGDWFIPSNGIPYKGGLQG